MRKAQLEYFVAAARTLSFTEAAQQCHVAQPAISQQIHALEGELGFSLFVRETRGMRLTDAGQAYYEDAQEVLRHLDDAERRGKLIAGGETGNLSIGTSGATQGSDFEIIRGFHDDHPRIVLSFKSVQTGCQGALLTSGFIDTLFTDVKQLATLDAVRFAGVREMDLCLMVGRQHPLAQIDSITYEEAARQTLIFAKPSDAVGQGSLVSTMTDGGGKRLFADTQDNVMLMVRLGLGAAIAPESVATSVPDDVVLLPTRGYWPKIKLGWGYLASNNNPALAPFIAYVDKR